MRLRLAGIMLLASCTVSTAQEKTAIAGAGSFSCGIFAEHYKQDPKTAERAYTTWTQGFMSGLNMQRAIAKQPMRDIPVADRISASIRQSCDKRPLATFFEIALDYYASLPALPQSN